MPFGVKKEAGFDGLKLFNLDLHPAVIADIKHTLKVLYGSKVRVTDWSLSARDNTLYGFEKPAKNLGEVLSKELPVNADGTRPVMQVLSQAWYGIDETMIDRFLWRYSGELAQYDGFIVTHTPVFARLFEGFNKPVIVVNSCRYDQPYCFNGNEQELARLNACLKNLQDRGMLIAVSNNKADQEYLRLGTGIESVHIPSLCLYTNVHLDVDLAKEHSALMTCNVTLKVPAATQQRFIEAGLLPPVGIRTAVSGEENPKKAVSWHELYHRRALIHLPYEISTMSLFEQYSAGVVLLLPSRRFCEELMKNQKDGMDKTGIGTLTSWSSYWQYAYVRVVRRPLEEISPELREKAANLPLKQDFSAVKNPEEIERDLGASCIVTRLDRSVPQSLQCTTDVNWWLDRADFYDSEWFPGIKYFDSWEQMIELANQSPEAGEREQHMEWIRTRNEKVYSMWRSLLMDKFPKLNGL